MMPGEAHRRAAQYALGALLAALLGLGVVFYQAATLLFAAAACLAAILLLGGSPAADYLCFLALFSGPPRIRARDPLASLNAEIDWVVLLHVAVWLLGALWVIRQGYRFLVRGKSLPFTWIHFLGLLLALLLGLSLFGSPGPWLTLFRAMQLAVMVVFGFLWVEKLGPAAALRSLFWGYAALALVIGAAALFRPELVFAGERVRGDYIANAGGVGAMGFILLMSYPPRLPRWLAVLLFGLFAAVLIFSLTRSAYFAVMLFLALAAIRRPEAPALRSMYVALGLLVVMLLLFGLMPAAVAWIVRDPASLESFSGRIPLWKYLVPIMWQKSPLFGLGFYAASRVYSLQLNAGIGTAHSAFIEVLVGGGVLGFGVFLAVVGGALLRSIKGFARHGKDPQVFVGLALLSAVISLGIVSEEMVIASPTALSFWIVLSVVLRQGGSKAMSGAGVARPQVAAG
jgi:O-antigen ligase